ncbi:MAG: hypothetical protein M1834_009358 [Cirrosporium novae-zelandiae]|nr:MAG: hypothetical protein M1834_009358 [Cirrosporium novae-zelandiae]
MAEPKTTLIDLPNDILFLIFPYLEPKDFLSFVSTNKTLYSSHLEPSYWRHVTRKTFRYPNQPLLNTNGERWQWLYKSLRTRSKVYTWGQNNRGELGHNYVDSRREQRIPPRRRRLGGFRHISWPTDIGFKDTDPGIIVDLQCGGWSTSLLNQDGAIFVVGILDGERSWQGAGHQFMRLSFPEAYITSSYDFYEPSTAIRQFSAGRSHILGLSDSGRIWTWHDMRRSGRHIKFWDIDLCEGEDGGLGLGRVKKVVAGWGESSAYIEGSGIVYWNIGRESNDENKESDAWLLKSTALEGTGLRRSRTFSVDRDSLEAKVGEVIEHVVLEGYIVFITDLNKVFAAATGGNTSIVEIEAFASEDRTLKDIQGSFRKFAVFTGEGEVLQAEKSLLDAYWNRDRNDSSEPPRLDAQLPSLQHNNVIALAFGDYHLQALHSDGTITSYGRQSNACGCLGLGDRNAGGELRGLRSLWNGDEALVPPAQGHKDRGHEIFFDEPRKEWLAYMEKASRETEALDRRDFYLVSQHNHSTLAEWFEQEGRAFYNDFVDENDGNEETIPLKAPSNPYFALSITAAGWHSGALILVNEDLAERQTQHYLVPNPTHDSPKTDKDEQDQNQSGSSTSSSNHKPAVQSQPIQHASPIAHQSRRVLFPGIEPLAYHPPTITARPPPSPESATPENRAKDPQIWAWEEQKAIFPRLRMPNGEIAPGDETTPIATWRGECPPKEAE